MFYYDFMSGILEVQTSRTDWGGSEDSCFDLDEGDTFVFLGQIP